MSYCTCGKSTKSHEIVYLNDINKLNEEFDLNDIEKKDCGGNTPLLLAIKTQKINSIVFIFIK